MLFRRSASIVETEVSTSCGRRIARRGSRITRDTATRAITLCEDERFQATHEALRWDLG